SNGSQSNNSSSNVQGIGTGSLVNTTFLHFRQQASIDSPIISTLNENSKITVLAKDGEWYKVEVNGQVGYVYGYYLQVTPNNPSNNSNNNSNSSNGSQSNNSSSNAQGIGTGSLVNTTFLHFRQQASIDSPIISTLNENSQITVLAKDGEWYKVEVNGQVGYVYGYYLQVTPNGSSNNSNNNSNSSQSNNSSSNVQGIGTGSLVNTTFLHFRQQASIDSPIISTLNENSKITVLAKDGEWYKVEVNGQVGYVYGYYLQVTPNGSSNNSNNNSSNSQQNNNNTVSIIGTGSLVNTTFLHLRQEPTVNSNIISTLNENSKINVIAKEGYWYKVEVNGQIGYVDGYYLDVQYNGNSSNISSRFPTPNSNEITTNYPISLQQYVNLQEQAWPLFSAQQFENAINPKSISNMFEFLRIDQFRAVHLNKLNELLEGCGVLTGQGQAFIDACQEYNIDPVYFVNQSILETGYGTSRLASGVTISEIAIPSEPIYNSNGQLVGYQMKKLPHPVTVYNLFGIGAYDNSSVFPNRALILGTTYAYNHGWTSVPNAIAGAAQFVSNGYIHNSYYNQNTVYKLRYSPVINSLWHQYATNYAYANEIANLMEQNMDLYDSGDKFTYDVPVFQS
ncbi:SH3 domain-containing protein, partial [Clostridium mediterraneense]|uniref:SH3 domain-containing protein n=2 Tax=Clostridium mediterraneense TaxID=1805472 RepID=UPI001356376C